MRGWRGLPGVLGVLGLLGVRGVRSLPGVLGLLSVLGLLGVRGLLGVLGSCRAVAGKAATCKRSHAVCQVVVAQLNLESCKAKLAEPQLAVYLEQFARF